MFIGMCKNVRAKIYVGLCTVQIFCDNEYAKFQDSIIIINKYLLNKQQLLNNILINILTLIICIGIGKRKCYIWQSSVMYSTYPNMSNVNLKKFINQIVFINIFLRVYLVLALFKICSQKLNKQINESARIIIKYT